MHIIRARDSIKELRNLKNSQRDPYKFEANRKKILKLIKRQIMKEVSLDRRVTDQLED
jgi:hypothetical protein